MGGGETERGVHKKGKRKKERQDAGEREREKDQVCCIEPYTDATLIIDMGPVRYIEHCWYALGTTYRYQTSTVPYGTLCTIQFDIVWQTMGG